MTNIFVLFCFVFDFVVDTLMDEAELEKLLTKFQSSCF